MAFPWVPEPTWADDEAGGTEIDAAALNNFQDGIKAAGVQGLAATPPASPVDGMIWRLPASAATGVYWYFQYDSSQTTYKWVAMGAQVPLMAEVATNQGTTSATYAALATAGPSVALPRAGDYIVSIGALAYNATDSGGAWMSYDIGATGAVDADGVNAVATGATTVGANVMKPKRKDGLTAVTLTAKYKRGGAGTGQFLDRWMSVVPVRII